MPFPIQTLDNLQMRRSEEHTSELQSRGHLVCRRLLENKTERPGAVLSRHFANEANPEIHRKTTAEEISKDTVGNVDIVVAQIDNVGTTTCVSQLRKAP